MLFRFWVFPDCTFLDISIQQYICYYNTRCVQRNLGVLTPMEKHALCLAT